VEVGSLKLVCFSPTGTTRAVVQGIGRGIGSSRTENLDITLPRARRAALRTAGSDLLVLAVPVYMGRVPALLSDWLNAMRAENTPTVCVVVYGNRVYDNALLELRDRVASRGCVPFAAGAFIGEHSFSDSHKPIAAGRPSEDDLSHAAMFGRKIRERLAAATSISDLSPVSVPGSYPYGGITELWDVDFIAVDDRCEECGVCAAVCPTGAIDAEDGSKIDQVACITCCACIKHCPNSARTKKPGAVTDARNRLFERCSVAKHPETFL
jgi:Pyruvate/2-oxoacid:ferredoxin oxidoreductase delta subunit